MTEKNEKEKQDSKKPVESSKPGSLVFISHDTRDAKLAEAFSSLLKSVSAGVLKSFRSSDRKGNQGIEFGVEWYPEIIKNIKEASDVVCLLTQHSVDRPWILFEAGMAKGKLETPILGVALGISLKEASSGPFAQFQNCDDDEESLTKLVFQLVDRIPNSEPDEETIRFQVGKFKRSISEILKAAKNPKKDLQANKPESNDSSAKLFEEIKVMFQDLPARIGSNLDPDMRRRKRRHIHPRFVDEIMHMSKNPKLGIIVGLSLLREPLPWLYESGMEVLRKANSNSSLEKKRAAIRDFEELSMMSSSKMMYEFIDSKESMMLYEEMPHLLLRAFERYLSIKG